LHANANPLRNSIPPFSQIFSFAGASTLQRFLFLLLPRIAPLLRQQFLLIEENSPFLLRLSKISSPRSVKLVARIAPSSNSFPRDPSAFFQLFFNQKNPPPESRFWPSSSKLIFFPSLTLEGEFEPPSTASLHTSQPQLSPVLLFFSWS